MPAQEFPAPAALPIGGGFIPQRVIALRSGKPETPALARARRQLEAELRREPMDPAAARAAFDALAAAVTAAQAGRPSW